MTQEEKQLLLKDLCARLPYNIMVRVEVNDVFIKPTDEIATTSTINMFDYPQKFKITPYLHSIPNLTEEAQTQLGRLLGAASYNILKGDYSYLKELLEYVYKNHIDLFGLIPKGLALEAPKELYKT